MRHAFPSTLGGAVERIVRGLHATHEPTEQSIGPVRLRGEPLSIPHRVYFAPTATNSVIASCIFSRHSDGFVRQRHLERLIDVDELWVVPFVLQFLGEYVIELVEIIATRRDILERPLYKEFALENPAFLALTRRRATSYWNCYHRDRFRKKDTYPALQLLLRLADVQKIE